MNCDKALKLIRDKFAGGISPSDENLLGQHIESCPDCREFYKREKAITDDLKSLDYNKYREDSIEAFGRLAVAVRSYRSPKSRWLENFQVKPMRAAWVTTLLLLIIVGLSNLNFSYSHTNGANLRIDFNPPLEKSQSMNINEFYSKLNDTLTQTLSDPDSPRKISWAIQMESDALESLSIDIKTDEAIDIADIYDSLLEHYPSFARGEVSICPLKEELQQNAFKMIVARKPDTIEDDEIRKIVSEVLPKNITQVENKLRMIEEESEKIQKIIDADLSHIRELISDINEITSSANASMDLTTILMQEGGGQLEDLSDLYNPFTEFRIGIKEILVNGGINIDELNLDDLIKFDFDNGTTRIIIGNSDNLFEPHSIGGRKISIIHGSGKNVNLNGANDVIKSAEIDDLLSGTIKPDELESIISGRLRENNKETIVIEVYRGKKRAEITIKDNEVNVNLTSPPIKNIRIKTPRNRELENNEDYKEMLKWKEQLSSEREIVLRHFDSTSEDDNSNIFPAPVFQQQECFLHEIVTEDEIKALADGVLKPSELEEIIRKRINKQNAPTGNRNIALIRDGKIISIKIVDENVLINMDNQSSTNIGSGSVVVTHPDEQNVSSSNKFDLIRDGIITEQEIDDIMRGKIPVWVAEKKLSSRLDEKYGDKWSYEFSIIMKRTENDKSLEIRIEEGEVMISLQ
jgi:hypothetical protein